MEKNLRLRILTCIVGIPVVVGGIFLFQDYNFIFFSILAIAFALLGSIEMSRMLFKGKTIPLAVIAPALPLLQYLQGIQQWPEEIMDLFFMILLLAVFSVEIMREIRRNLKDYQQYWFWGMYNEIWKVRLFQDKSVLEEMRLLAEEVFRVCPKDQHYAVIGCMANMEDDEHIDAFLDAYASREDMSRSTLLFNRYKMREELDKIEPVRQYVLWMELSHIISAANDWQVYLCDDPNHFIWFCETQLNYLNAVNNLSPDKKYLVSGGTGTDLWCEERIELGIRYTAAFAKLKRMNEAYDAFEDTLRVIEQIMSVTDEEFKIGCSSPALKGFTLECEINWIEKDGKEYKEISMLHNDWWNWIVPLDYQKVFKRDCFDIMRADKRFDSLFERLDKCVIYRALPTG